MYLYIRWRVYVSQSWTDRPLRLNWKTFKSPGRNSPFMPKVALTVKWNVTNQHICSLSHNRCQHRYSERPGGSGTANTHTLYTRTACQEPHRHPDSKQTSDEVAFFFTVCTCALVLFAGFCVVWIKKYSPFICITQIKLLPAAFEWTFNSTAGMLSWNQKAICRFRGAVPVRSASVCSCSLYKSSLHGFHTLYWCGCCEIKEV